MPKNELLQFVLGGWIVCWALYYAFMGFIRVLGWLQAHGVRDFPNPLESKRDRGRRTVTTGRVRKPFHVLSSKVTLVSREEGDDDES